MLRIAIFNDTEPDAGHYGCALVMRNLINLFEDAGAVVVFRWPFNKDWRAHPDRMPHRDAIDLILVNGEGTMHDSDRRSQPTILAELGEFARKCDVPIFLVNASLYSNSASFYKRLECFHGIYVRDEASASEAHRHGLSAVVVPDLTISYPSVSYNRQGAASTQERLQVGVTDSVHDSVSRRLRSLAQRGGLVYRPMVDTSAHWPGIRKLLSPVRLSKTIRAYARERRHGKDIRFSDAEQFVEWIASQSLIVTGRYHTVTLCLVTKTPFVYVESNSPKISALLEDVGLDGRRKLSEVPQTFSHEFAERYRFSTDEHSKIQSFLLLSRRGAEEMAGSILRRVP
ncbi:polysaccharide pyruvyl transferase family protein [Rhizobium sp. G187]|uniref:polysaccharide pyruvyl transferase family protein n=1 Tax=Rhizobium sp. G187 TaxID=3451352 RepID=UPI003EE5DF89